MRKPCVVFLCTGNACRSQMAEGWLRHLAKDRFEVISAGIEAHGVDPRAVAVMREAGVDISRQSSKVLDPAWLEKADVVITLCGHADEHCPRLPARCRKEHWPLEDPARAVGTEEEVMAVFRRVRDEIRARVQHLIAREKV